MPAAEDLRIELRGLRVEARIGVTEAERAQERPLLIDLDVVPVEVAATVSDELEDTVDYADLAARAGRIARSAPWRTLERLAAEIADAVLDAGGIAEVGVRVAKPEPPMNERVDQAAVRCVRGVPGRRAGDGR